jgi:putative DNA primase/helicase
MSNLEHILIGDQWEAAYPNTRYGLLEWRRYDNGIWEAVSDYQIKKEIRDMAVQLAKAQVVTILVTSGMISSVKGLLEAKLFVPDKLWDSNPDLLVCRNGTLEISIRKLRKHCPNDYMTGGVDFDYDPDAGAPTWMDFLEDVISNEMNFLQEFVGYCLTTSTIYEISIWLYGLPGGGKSTFITGVQAMLGSRVGLLGLSEIERSRFALSQIVGKTLVVSTEQPSAFLQATHTLNAIISGEPIIVDRKFKEAIQIQSKAKVMFGMNEFPRVGDAGNGLFRRVYPVKFVQIDETLRDPQIKERIKQEGQGILNWALAGLERLTARARFEIPPSVRAAADDFKMSNDIPAVFVDECCDKDPNEKVQSSLLYQAYSAWCYKSGHKAQSSTSVAKEWERLGFKKDRNMLGIFWQGLNIKP